MNTSTEMFQFSEVYLQRNGKLDLRRLPFGIGKLALNDTETKNSLYRFQKYMTVSAGITWKRHSEGVIVSKDFFFALF